MKLKPLHDWAVLVPSAADERTAGGLFIPDSAKEKPREGVVEAIGPGALEEEKHGQKKKEGEERKFIPSVVKPGDVVLYESWAGQTIQIGNEERVVVRERSILGLIDRPPRAASVPALRSSTALAHKQPAAPPAVLESRSRSTNAAAKPAKKKAAKKAALKSKPKAKAKANANAKVKPKAKAKAKPAKKAVKKNQAKKKAGKKK